MCAKCIYLVVSTFFKFNDVFIIKDSHRISLMISSITNNALFTILTVGFACRMTMFMLYFYSVNNMFTVRLNGWSAYFTAQCTHCGTRKLNFLRLIEIESGFL